MLRGTVSEEGIAQQSDPELSPASAEAIFDDAERVSAATLPLRIKRTLRAGREQRKSARIQVLNSSTFSKTRRKLLAASADGSDASWPRRWKISSRIAAGGREDFTFEKACRPVNDVRCRLLKIVDTAESRSVTAICLRLHTLACRASFRM